MPYTEKQIILADSLNAIVTRFGAFEKDDDANGCDYKDATQNANAGGKCCAECIFFRGAGCAIVNGAIESMGVCRFWIIDEVGLVESEYSNGTEQEETSEDDSGNAYGKTQGQAKNADGLQSAYEEEVKVLLDRAISNKLATFVDEAKNLVYAMPWALANTVDKGRVDNLLSIKSIDDNIYSGIGIVYGGQDLVGDTFLKTTDLGAERDFKGMPLYFDHAQDNVKDPIGTVIKSESDDTGVWFQFQLDKRNKYSERVKDLLHSGALGLSTGALNHLVVRENGQIKRWIIGELSLTTTPAEPRTFVNNVEVVPQKTENVVAQPKQYVFVLKK
jgi:hypothetical protein